MSDLISRQALCEYALNQKDKSVTPNDIMRFSSAEPETHEERTETHACDLISRQAAIELVKDVCDAIMSGCETWYDPETEDEVYEDFREVDAILKCNKEVRIALRNMPSAQPEVLACGEGELIAQPEIVRCKDCTFYRSDGCFFSTAEIEEDGFCSWAERKTDG